MYVLIIDLNFDQFNCNSAARYKRKRTGFGSSPESVHEFRETSI